MPLIPYLSRTDLSWTPADYLAAVSSADGGNLTSAAAMVDAMMKDDRIGGVLETRVKGMLSLPSTIEAADGSTPPVIDDWSTVFPEAEQEKLLGVALMLGFCWARKERHWDDEAEIWRMKIKAWDPKWFSWRDAEQAWYVQARSIIEPGTYGTATFRKVSPLDGWVFYAPFGEDHPWRMGLWHRLAVPYLAKTYAVDDRSREGEVTTILAGLTKGLSEAQREDFLEDLKGLARDSRVVLPEGCDLKAISRSDGTSASIHSETIEWADQAITITIAGQLTTTEGTEGFSSGQVQKQVLASLLRSQEETFSTTVGEQALTDWARLSVGWQGATLYPRWQIQDPNDLTAQGYAAKQLADSIESINRALSADNVRIDIKQVMERTGLPITSVPTAAEAEVTQKLQLAPTDIARAVTINEARASIGLPAEEGGERKLAEVAQKEEIETVAAEEAITENTKARYRRHIEGRSALHTRAKPKLQLRSLRQAPAINAADDNPPERFLLFAMGDNDSDKGNARLTPEGIQSIFALLGSRDVMIDLEHLSLDKDSPNYDPDARGWLRLEADDSGLWATDTKWTADGRRRLEQKLQRYISPAFYCDPEDNETIIELVNIALTSLPATTYGQPLVAASKGMQMDTEQMMAALRVKLGLAEDAPIEEILVKVLDAMGPTEEPAAEPEPEPEAAPEVIEELSEEEDPEAMTATEEEDPTALSEEGEKPDEASRAAIALAKLTNKRLDKIEKQMKKQSREALIRRNRAKLPGNLLKWARNAPLPVLRDYLAEAPAIADDSLITPEPEPVTLSRRDKELCDKFGTDPDKVKAIRERDSRRR